MTRVLKPEEKKLLQAVLHFSKLKKKKLYLVGGYLRDILLKREKENPDLDFCLKAGAINFGRALKKDIGAGFVVLDKEHGSCRLLKRLGNRIYTLDFTDFRGKNLEDDLLHRDFTINSLAMGLEEFLGRDNFLNNLIDYYQAKDDLKAGVIRCVNMKSFHEDPLRILRAFSLSAIFGFIISVPTLKLIKKEKEKLSQVSFERVRDEIFKIFDRPDSFKYLEFLDELKILKIIIPEIEIMRGVKQGPYHHLDVFKHSLESVRQVELVMQELKRNKDLENYFDEPIAAQRKRRSLIKLGILLHDIGKPGARRRRQGKLIFHGHEKIGKDLTRIIARRLKLSNDEVEALEKMVFWHLRPGYLADNEEISRRAKFRYFRDTQKEAASVLVISLADQRSTCGLLTTRKSRIQHEKMVSSLLKEYFRKQKEKKAPRLISGGDLIAKLKIPPSPLIGKILSEIEELQAIGKIKNKQEALKFAEKVSKSVNQGTSR